MSEKFSRKSGGETSEGSNLVFVKPADLSRAGFSGVVAEGEFVETLPNRFDETRHDFKIVADTPLKIEGVDKDGQKYVKEVNVGDIIIVNGAGNLNYHMKPVSLGELCQITYNGKAEIAKGKMKGTLAHTFQVAYE